MATNKKLPSPAQARRLATLWASEKKRLSVMTKGPKHSQEPYNDPTVLSLVKYGWVTATGEKQSFANETEWDIYELNLKGTDALESFLYEARFRRMVAPA
jgi:hypothetical protein